MDTVFVIVFFKSNNIGTVFVRRAPVPVQVFCSEFRGKAKPSVLPQFKGSSGPPPAQPFFFHRRALRRPVATGFKQAVGTAKAQIGIVEKCGHGNCIHTMDVQKFIIVMLCEHVFNNIFLVWCTRFSRRFPIFSFYTQLLMQKKIKKIRHRMGLS